MAVHQMGRAGSSISNLSDSLILHFNPRLIPSAVFFFFFLIGKPSVCRSATGGGGQGGTGEGEEGKEENEEEKEDREEEKEEEEEEG